MINISARVGAEFELSQGEIMLHSVHAFLGRFIVYPNGHVQTAHALWCVHTHLMDTWDTTPRLAFLSAEPASGKTRALEITELLVPNAVSAVNVSPAYLFRKVGCEEGATILYDEIDTVFGPKAKENEEIRGLLNAGHRRGAVAGRCVVRGKTVETEEISAYAAVALAGLGWLPDTILSRSIIIRMRRRDSGETVEPFRRRIHYADGTMVRGLIEHWAQEHARQIKWPELPVEIQDRDADVWEPLIAIADGIGGEWPERARAAAVALVMASREAEPSLGIRLLSDLRVIFGDASQMPTEIILRELHSLKEAPWNDLKGKPLNDRGLAQRLRQYEVRPTVLGGGAQRGYKREELHDAWKRYLPPLAPSDGSVTSVIGATSVTDKQHITDITDVTLAAGHESAACAHCGCPGTKADPLLDAAIDGRMVQLHRGCIDDFAKETAP